ncbi:MAG: HIT domain-containing protein [Candidatus Paracaedimonas acanthamoebae]|uniref:HIT domain-containing protein n=1 Tax=Candidatus Paracaedimonas acanthamoebae TaxID=244581 RepID=A0A8J7TTV4_9PROT|nr:HIT domain-containing protein [Candidatus Paracaedimonas acanthamoebae]
MSYDEENIFARILRGEIPCRKIFENNEALAFHDAYPKAPIHAIVIPKAAYQNVYEFYQKATPDQMKGFSEAILNVIDLLGLKEYGYRMITNHGLYGGQEIPHFHVHLLGGKPLGRMVANPN